MSKRSDRVQPRRNRCATAATEFALVLPLMIVFALGCTDLGRMVHHQIAVANSARTAAEYGSMHSFTPHTRADWEARVRETALAELPGVAPDDVTIGIETDVDSRGLFNVAVTVRCRFPMVAPWPGRIDELNISHHVTMRQTR